MRSLYVLIIATLALLGLPAFADDQQPPLNMVQCRISAESWAKTNTARVVVNVNAVLDEDELEDIHANILKQLAKIASDVDWHVTNFSRYEDSSDLEKVTINAEARVPEADLPKIRERVDSVSRKGEKYTISNIEFTPSLSEIEKTRSTVRDDIFKKVNEELAHLNKVYPEQHFVVHEIDFVETPGPSPLQLKRAPRMMTMSVKPSAGVGLAVSDKVKITANVIFARQMSKQS